MQGILQLHPQEWPEYSQFQMKTQQLPEYTC